MYASSHASENRMRGYRSSRRMWSSDDRDTGSAGAGGGDNGNDGGVGGVQSAAPLPMPPPDLP